MRNLYETIKGYARKHLAVGGLLVAFGLGGLESKLYSDEIHIPRDYATIQAGINTAKDGDTILVKPGDYQESINFKGKDITLRSSEGPDVTYLDSVVFEDCESNVPILDGFRITSIQSRNCSPMIVHNIVTGSFVGGIRCINGNPKILNNIIYENFADTGGGIYYASETDSIVIRRNNIYENRAIVWGGGIFAACPKITIEDNIIARNETYDLPGGGIALNVLYDTGISELSSTKIYITNNTITRNCRGGIFFGRHIGDIKISSSIIWGNIEFLPDATPVFEDLINVEFIDPSQISYSNIGNSRFCGERSNICQDPLFLDPGSYDFCHGLPLPPENKDFSLQPNSPCIDAGSPDSPLDPDGTRADMGAIYFDQIKNRFIRGDVNKDGKVDISDAVAGLYHVFRGRELECRDAADVNDDGKIDVADPIYLLNYLFRDGPSPLAPFPDEGYDFTHDTIECYLPKLFEDD